MALIAHIANVDCKNRRLIFYEGGKWSSETSEILRDFRIVELYRDGIDTARQFSI